MFPILRLPAEIRAMIYHVAATRLQYTYPIRYRTRDYVHEKPHEDDEPNWHLQKICSNMSAGGATSRMPELWHLATTCRTVYHEAMPILYRHLKVLIDICHQEKHSPPVPATIASPALLRRVQHLQINMPIQPDTDLTFAHFFRLFDWGADLRSLTIQWQVEAPRYSDQRRQYLVALVDRVRPEPTDAAGGGDENDSEAEGEEEKEAETVEAFVERCHKACEGFLRVRAKLLVRAEAVQRVERESHRDDTFMSVMQALEQRRVELLGLPGEASEGGRFFVERFMAGLWPYQVAGYGDVYEDEL